MLRRAYLRSLARALRSNFQCSEIRPWSLPNIEAPLSEGESKHDVVQDVMQVRFVKPGAAIPSPVPRDIAQAFLDRVTDSSAYAEGVESQSVIGSVQNALSVQKDSQALEFFSTVFTSTSNLDIEPLGPSLDETVYRLHRHNHLATMSLLRQLYSLGILVPVFGVLLSQNFVSMHVDWPSEASGCMVRKISCLLRPVPEESYTGSGFGILRLRGRRVGHKAVGLAETSRRP